MKATAPTAPPMMGPTKDLLSSLESDAADDDDFEEEEEDVGA